MTSLDNSSSLSKAENLNVTEGEDALDLVGNDNSKSHNFSQAAIESESMNSEVMETTADSSSESALQSPDSAIGVTPTLTPDLEFQKRLPEKPDAEVKPIEHSQTVEGSVMIGQSSATTEIEPQNGNVEENQNISTVNNADQMSQDSEQTEKTSAKLISDTVKEDEISEKSKEEPDLEVLKSKLETSVKMASDDGKVDELQEKSSEESVLAAENSVVADVSIISDAGYEEDDEDNEEEEEEISENGMVVSASIQFPISEKNQKETLLSDQDKQEQQEEPIDKAIKPSSELTGGVTVQVNSQVSQPLPKEGSPSGFESDVEDNDEEESKEEPLVSCSKPVLKTSVSSSSSLQLPDTVSHLETPEGSSVFLVGTAHFSKESQEDVANTIRIVKPDIVVVELCKARTAILQLDEDTILQESRSLDFKKIQMILRQHGKIQGVLYLLLLSVSAHITKQLGMAPGGEFRTAFAEARRSAPGCLIQLGDRPIQITLSRALASLSLWHKFKLTWHILTSKEPISKEEVEKCKQRDFIEEMLAEMTGQFPAISEVFVKERDLYLCRSLQAAAQPVPNPMSPTGISPRVVVGVVGIGHVPGIVEHWGKVKDADIVPIMRIPPPSLSSKILKFTFKMTMYGLLGYGAYKCLPSSAKSAISSSVHSAVLSVTSVLPQKWQK